MSAPALFVSDVDGTLVDRRARLSAGTRARLTALLHAGLPFTVASARSALSLGVMLEGLPLTLPVVEFNGAFITDLATGHRPFVRALSEGVGPHVHELAHGLGLTPFVSTFDGAHDQLFVESARNEGSQWYLDERRAFCDPRLRHVDDVRVGFAQQVVCMTFIAREPELVPLFEQLQQHHAERVRVEFYENKYQPGWHWLSVHDTRATKAEALRELCATLDVPLANLTVFGDERNDIPMFEIAGRAVAVANAHSDVKACAHELIGDHEEDSVVGYLERVCGLESRSEGAES
jgi:Cof subfamily protein (haloacid dehalogenase superfamily)